MSSERSLAWLGREKEKEALKLSREHMKLITEVVDLMKKFIYSYSDGKKDLDEELKIVLNKEREADNKKAEVLKSLSKGNFPPLSREIIIRLILTVDDIADNARAAAGKTKFVESDALDDEVKIGLKQLADLSCESAKLLGEAFELLFEDAKDAIEKTEEIEKIEEKADYFRAENFIPSIVDWADESQRAGTSYLLVKIEENLEETIDQAENGADVIREIAIGSL